MSSKSRVKVGNLAFWGFLIGASGAAFGAGFWFTYGATVNVGTKSPVEAPKPLRTASSEVVTSSTTATPAPEASVDAGPVVATSAVPETAATATPPGVSQTAAPDPLAVATPAPARATLAPRATQAPAEGPQSEIYRVQVGPFDSRESAEKQVQELQTAGINAVVVYDGGRYQAQLGAFSDRARAISVADEVNTRGYSVTIRH